MKSFSTAKAKILHEGFKWPNEIKVVPKDVFGSKSIEVPDGFLPPGKSDGDVFILDYENEKWTPH